MRTIVPVHILAGSLALVSGYLALYATKGAPLHRRAGLVFFCVMLTMTFTGIVIAAVRGAAPALNIPAGLLTAYLVVTGFTTVRPPSRGGRWLGLAGVLVALGVGLFELTLGVDAVTHGGKRDGLPAFPFVMFGIVGLLAGVGDLRMIRAGGVRGTVRLTRHLWRMTYALWIATMSFFIGQADEIPKAIRIPGVLAVPVVTVLLTLLYWLWRVRIRRTVRGLVVVRAAETT